MRASVIIKNADKSKRGVIIGENAIIGACAPANRDITNGTAIVGVPYGMIRGDGNNE